TMKTQTVQNLEQRGHTDLLQLREDLIRTGDSSKTQVGVAGVYACHAGSPFHAWRYTGEAMDTLFRKSMKMDASSPCFSSQPDVATSSSESCGIRICNSLF